MLKDAVYKSVYKIREYCYWSFGVVLGGLGTPAVNLLNYFQFSPVFKALCRCAK